MTRVGVVGHVEWVDFAVSARLPRPGEILEPREAFAAAAGGGAVASVQLARLAGGSFFMTALGDDGPGAATREELPTRGVRVEAGTLAQPTRRAFTHLTDDHERTITTIGERLVPERAMPLDWALCDGADAIYFTGGDAGALRAARGARVLVATPRARDTLREAGVVLDVLVASGTDPGEAVEAFDPPPRHVVLTAGEQGGRWTGSSEGSWSAEELPAPPVDAYGCGDSFAAGLTYGLGAGLPLAAAVQLAARCGAHCLTGRGPYGAQLSAS